jgi:hypothetical protein
MIGVISLFVAGQQGERSEARYSDTRLVLACRACALFPCRCRRLSSREADDMFALQETEIPVTEKPNTIDPWEHIVRTILNDMDSKLGPIPEPSGGKKVLK